MNIYSPVECEPNTIVFLKAAPKMVWAKLCTDTMKSSYGSAEPIFTRKQMAIMRRRRFANGPQTQNVEPRR